MRSKSINDKYFCWLTDQIKDVNSTNHKKLLIQLHETPFGYLIDKDDNRFYDGIDLRYQFGDEKRIHHSQIATELDITPCSMLEMMVALCIRLERIMTNDKYGDRKSFWFWSMVCNLGLISCTDTTYNPNYVDEVLTTFLKRKYGKDGHGGLFITSRMDIDMRDTEIWYQAMIFLEEILDKEN